MTTQNTKLLTFALSLRGARFLAYASEQAPQSRWGQVDCREHFWENEKGKTE